MIIQFEGILADMFGKDPFDLDVRSVAEATKALMVMIDGLQDFVRDNVFHLWADDVSIPETDIAYNMRQSTVIRMAVAVGGGGGNGGIWYVVAGIALIVVGFYMPAAWGAGAQMMAYGLGAGLAFTGIAQMMMPKMPTMTDDEDGNKASYGFGGAVTTVSQGNVVPVAYGECFQGGFVLTWQMVADVTKL